MKGLKIGKMKLIDVDFEKKFASYSDVLPYLTVEKIYDFLTFLGVENIQKKGNYLICPTVCHNRLEEAESLKLYYYENRHLFHCYTECSESFSVATFLQKFYKINNNIDLSYLSAQEIVIKFVLDNENVFSRKEIDAREISEIDKLKLHHYDEDAYFENKPFPLSLLTYFPFFELKIWEREGISSNSMKKFYIGYDMDSQKITIPHRDINGNLIGIRGRGFDEEENKIYGKYRPLKIGTTLYNHALSFNLYGIFEHKKAIQKFKKAIIFEGEKSVLKHDTLYGDKSFAVATCGSSLSAAQVNLLVNDLGVIDITLAYDKEFDNIEKQISYQEKLSKMLEKYSYKANFYYILDKENLLEEKDSPIDKGKEVYEKLLMKRIKVRCLNK